MAELKPCPFCGAASGTGVLNEIMPDAHPKRKTRRGKGPLIQEERSGTSGTNNDQTLVCLDMTHACDVIRECGEISPSLQARMGTGGNQIPLCYGIGNGQANETSYPAEEVSQTLNTMHDAQAVYIPDKAHSLRANGADPHREDAATYVVNRPVSVVRRLTPLECTRLQGFPDGWVDIGDWVDTKGKKHKDSDSPKYKALGNSIALPFWRWMFQRMAEYLPEKAALGSLFDGIGGFPKCWEDVHGAGTALWASEIEEFPIAVTKTRFPGMEHLGDITKLNGAKLKPVHAVAGGSPCQDLSVAGKRKGLEGERSGLFMDQIRVVKEMRESSEQSGADEPVWPRYMVWENVPGALSCNGGRDFAAVLEETIRIADPEAPGIDVPEKGWPNWGATGMWMEDGLWLGECMTRNFGGSPSVAEESRLSQISEAAPPMKYCLSAKACQGILNRAQRRGKELPAALRDALIRQSKIM